jgi:transcriptional regulator MraZ
VVFSGRFDHAIDEKGRVSIPARFRETLQRDGHEALFITNWIHRQERCLALYPPNEWLGLTGKIRQRGSVDPAAQTFQMFVIGGAHEVQVDRQGRILIPPRLREYARLGRDVTFNALIDNFQLWDKSVLQRILEADLEQIMNPEFFAKLNL